MAAVYIFKGTFGFYPSFAFVENHTQGLKSYDNDLETMCKSIIADTFIKYVQSKDSTIMRAFYSAKDASDGLLQSQDCNRLKNFLWEWLSRDIQSQRNFLNDKTLFQGFKDYCSKRWIGKPLNICSFPELGKDNLDYKEVSIMSNYKYDAKAHYIILNKNYIRQVFGKILVVIPNETDRKLIVKIITTLGSYFENERFCIAVQAPLANLVKLNTNRNVDCISIDFIPHNCSQLCFYVVSDVNSTLHLGSTPVYRILLTQVTQEVLPVLTQTDIVAITTNNKKDIAKFIKNILPHACIPFFLPQEICNAYFRLFIDRLNKKDPRFVGRNALYVSLIPAMSTLNFDINNRLENTHSNRLGNNATNALVIIDNRPNPLSLLAILTTWANILDKNNFDIVVVTKQDHYDYYKNVVPFCKILLVPQLNQIPFDIYAYNELLKSRYLWKKLIDLGYEKCLIVQDDGILVRKGLESSLFMKDITYVGAPWIICEENRELTVLTKNNMVGNGGFSLRDLHDMLDIIDNKQKESQVLFNNRLQPVQEDVFYVTFAKSIPSYNQAMTFSTEEHPYEHALGFHKPWNYQRYDQILALAHSIIDST
jgi:hypothetical protein